MTSVSFQSLVTPPERAPRLVGTRSPLPGFCPLDGPGWVLSVESPSVSPSVSDLSARLTFWRLSHAGRGHTVSFHGVDPPRPVSPWLFPHPPGSHPPGSPPPSRFSPTPSHSPGSLPHAYLAPLSFSLSPMKSQFLVVMPLSQCWEPHVFYFSALGLCPETVRRARSARRREPCARRTQRSW